jgi:hypothetical protein
MRFTGKGMAGGLACCMSINGQGGWLLEMADALYISGEPNPIGGLTLAPPDITDYTSAVQRIADGVEADPNWASRAGPSSRKHGERAAAPFPPSSPCSPASARCCSCSLPECSPESTPTRTERDPSR